jgi:predicted nucleic acid-binding protein
VKTFIDTNVLIYWVDGSARADVVEQLLAQECVISVQVLNEFSNVLRKKRAMPLADIQALSDTLVSVCEVYDLNLATHQTALALLERYKLSIFDANIVAAAGLSGCTILYSEDMQHGINIQIPMPNASGTGVSVVSINNPFHGMPK